MTAAESVQPVPWVEVVATLGCVEPARRPRRDQHVHHDLVPVEVPSLDQRGAGAELAGARGRRAPSSRGRAPSVPTRMRRLLEVGRHQRREGERARCGRLLGVGVEQPVAGGGDHHGVEDIASPADSGRCAAAIWRTSGGGGEHARLDGARVGDRSASASSWASHHRRAERRAPRARPAYSAR